MVVVGITDEQVTTRGDVGVNQLLSLTVPNHGGVLVASALGHEPTIGQQSEVAGGSGLGEDAQVAVLIQVQIIAGVAGQVDNAVIKLIPHNMVMDVGLNILVTISGGGSVSTTIDGVNLGGDHLGQVGLSVAVDQSVIDDVALAELILGDDVHILVDLVDLIAIVQVGVNSGQLDVVIAIDILDTSESVDGLHNVVGHAVAVHIHNLQPVAVLVAIDLSGVLASDNVLIHEGLPGDIAVIGDVFGGLGAHIDLAHNDGFCVAVLQVGIIEDVLHDLHVQIANGGLGTNGLLVGVLTICEGHRDPNTQPRRQPRHLGCQWSGHT